jgi:predicted transcriptional regulator
MPRKNASEQEILKVLKNSQEKGILQTDLWKEANINSKDGSRAILKLEKKGLIERKKELHEGKWTYRIMVKHKFTKVNSIADVPCAFCDIENKCELEPEAEISPIKCEKLTQWLMKALKKENQDSQHNG